MACCATYLHQGKHMTEIQTEQTGGQGLEKGRPPERVNFVVECEKIRCLAYRTADGKWMATFTNQELKNVIRFDPLPGCQ